MKKKATIIIIVLIYLDNITSSHIQTTKTTLKTSILYIHILRLFKINYLEIKMMCSVLQVI
jgi:hypothetical protein